MRVRKVGSVIAGATLAIGMIVGGAHAASMKNRYTQTNLTSDGTVTGTITDAHLLNPWGLTYFPGGPFWISDNNGGVSTLYDGLGNIIPLVVNIPAPPGSSAAAGSPTGIVFNANAGFFLIPGTTDPTFFIFATEDGTIAAWSETFDLLNAHIVVDNSQGGSAMGAVYKGLAMGNTSAGTFLYATNFRSGKVDVFDTSFTQVTPSGSFKDPKVPAGWAPFGVTNIRGNLFVTWVMQDAAKHDPVNGKNSGYISIFDTNGNLIKDFAAKTHLNSPWG
ncbi:MAG: TIGR03118 family protein, partial [Candidatus Binataceae bacterium]